MTPNSSRYPHIYAAQTVECHGIPRIEYRYCYGNDLSDFPELENDSDLAHEEMSYLYELYGSALELMGPSCDIQDKPANI